MSVIVQKFGGTSVATPQAREALLKQVKQCKEAGNEVVVVVSALGRSGDPYATDTLISLLEGIDPHISPGKKDLIMSCGEIISCAIISHLLESSQIASVPLTGFQAGIQTTDVYGNSEILNIDTTSIKRLLWEGKVPVIAGFQGIAENGAITTLGRGGSDTAAVAIGGYLKAERVDIYTDVLGIAKVDPRIVDYASYVEAISYEDMFQLAKEGAKVIHPRAVATAQKFQIPVRVRSTFSENPGTLITVKREGPVDKIIGIAVEKEVKTAPTGETIGKIFILFDESRKEQIQQELAAYLEESETLVDEMLWGDHHLDLLLPTSRLNETVQGLYGFYHGVKVNS